MTAWDRADRLAAAAVNRLAGERVYWRPMLESATPEDDIVEMPGGTTPDPTRPVRELKAVITWRSTTRPLVIPPGGGSLGDSILLVDFDWSDFAPGAEPRKGDYIELTEEPRPQDRMVRVDRANDDGSLRWLCYCQAVES